MRDNISRLDVSPGYRAPAPPRAAPARPPAPVEVRRMDARIRDAALDLAGGDYTRLRIEPDGSMTVVNTTRPAPDARKPRQA